MWVRDGLYGDVFVTDAATDLLDTPDMQRLRRVSQTAFASLIYPSANHTRFEHSIGTYYLSGRWAQFHNLSREDAEAIAIHGLLHDIGHSSFSHALEPLVKQETGKGHEEWTELKKTKGPVSEALEKHGIQKTKYAEVIDGDIGTDRMDYLQRDSFNTGVAYGTVDTDRILRKLKYFNHMLVLEEKAVSAAESMLLARFRMFPTVYAHHVTMTAEVMLSRSVEQAVIEKLFKAKELVFVDDSTLVTKLREAEGFVEKMITRITNRNLFKQAVYTPLKTLNDWLFLGGLSSKDKNELECEMANRTGMDSREVILNIPTPWFGEINVNILRENDLYSLSELSLISRLLKEAQWDYCNVSVFCPKEKTKTLEPVAMDVLKHGKEVLGK